MAEFDVCVIGAGPAGYAATMRAWDYGKRVCVIERGRVGGAGVHHGALSSKTLWELSRDYRRALQRDRGFSAERVDVSFEQVRHAVETAVGERTNQLSHQLEALGRSLPGRKGTITFIRGSASFIDPHRVHIDGPDRIVEAENFVIATGSSPRSLPDIEVDGRFVMTSDHVMRLDHFPRSLVILGAGVVGCEYATIFANYGRTKVYLIDRADRILPFEDADVAQLCATRLEAKGVTIHHKARLLDMKVVDDQVAYTIQHATGGVETITVERALISIGRSPNTRNLGLEKVGVKLSPRGHMEVSGARSVSVPHIYGAGDLTHSWALVSVAEIEGRHAVDQMYDSSVKPLSYDNISSIMFLDPEVAGVGLNEKQAQAARIPYKVAVYGYSMVSRAIAMRATNGFLKLLVSDDDEMRILGMRALGVHASTSIETVALMIHQQRPVSDLAEVLHPHPSVTEGLQDCVRMLLGTSILKPCVFRSQLRVSNIGYLAETEGTGKSEKAESAEVTTKEAPRKSAPTMAAPAKQSEAA